MQVLAGDERRPQRCRVVEAHDEFADQSAHLVFPPLSRRIAVKVDPRQGFGNKFVRQIRRQQSVPDNTGTMMKVELGDASCECEQEDVGRKVIGARKIVVMLDAKRCCQDDAKRAAGRCVGAVKTHAAATMVDRYRSIDRCEPCAARPDALSPCVGEGMKIDGQVFDGLADEGEAQDVPCGFAAVVLEQENIGMGACVVIPWLAARAGVSNWVR